MRACVFAILCLLPTFAIADERGTFVTLDREGTANAVGLDISALLPNQDAPDAALRQNLWGRYVSPLGIGAYGQFAGSQTFGDVDHGAISGLEVGGLYVMDLAGVGDLTLRFGLGLPTGPSQDLPAVATNVYTTLARPHDAALAVPRAVWLRSARASAKLAPSRAST